MSREAYIHDLTDDLAKSSQSQKKFGWSRKRMGAIVGTSQSTQPVPQVVEDVSPLESQAMSPFDGGLEPNKPVVDDSSENEIAALRQRIQELSEINQSLVFRLKNQDPTSTPSNEVHDSPKNSDERYKRWIYDPNLNVWEVLEKVEKENDPSFLRVCKSLSQKKAVLDTALTRFGADVTVAVLIFLRDTLSHEIFSRILISRPAALRQYCAWLFKGGRLRDLIRVYEHFQMRFEHGLLLLRQSFVQMDPRKRISNLKYSAQFFGAIAGSVKGVERGDLVMWSETSARACGLVERQVRIEEFDARVAETSDVPFYDRFPPQSIVFSSVADTLFYNHFYHPDARPPKISSPEGLRKAFEISDPKYMWLKLKAHATAGDWDAIRSMPLQKGLFSSKKMRSKIGFDPFIEVVHTYKGPRELMTHFIACIKNVDRRMKTAALYHCYDAILQTLVSERDTDGIHQFIEYLDNELGVSVDAQICRNRAQVALNNPEIKWRKMKGRKRKG